MSEITELWETFFRERVKRHNELVDGYLRYIDRLSEKGLPPIFETHHLSELIGIQEDLLVRAAIHPESFYRSFDIPKRRGGSRSICVPSPSLKAIQNWIKENILDHLPIHDAAYGFVPGRSVVDNAKCHLGGAKFLRLDVKDFFPSIYFERVLSIFTKVGYPPNVSYVLAKLCTHEGVLPQGAPTSPVISNLVCFEMDQAIQDMVQSKELVYTRYADDITLSGQVVSTKDVGEVSRIAFSFGFAMNEEKTLFSRSGRKIIITGVSVSAGKLSLPKQSVRKIKADAHMILKYGYFKTMSIRQVMDPIFVERLLGKISFWLQIDPDNKTAQHLRNELILVSRKLDGIYLPPTNSSPPI